MSPVVPQSWRGRIVLVIGGGVDDDEKAVEEPMELEQEDDVDIRVEEAALALARAVFARGGRLAFADDAVLTPLFIEVALEYWEALPAEARPEDQPERRFTEAPLLLVGKTVRSPLHDAIEWARTIGCLQNSPEPAEAIEAALTVLIGGKPLPIAQDQVFDTPSRRPRVVALPSTGGAAHQSVDRGTFVDAEAPVIQRAFAERMLFVPPSAAEREREPQEQAPVPDYQYAVYPLVMSALLDAEADLRV